MSVINEQVLEKRMIGLCNRLVSVFCEKFDENYGSYGFGVNVGAVDWNLVAKSMNIKFIKDKVGECSVGHISFPLRSEYKVKSWDNDFVKFDINECGCSGELIVPFRYLMTKDYYNNDSTAKIRGDMWNEFFEKYRQLSYVKELAKKKEQLAKLKEEIAILEDKVRYGK